MKARGSKATRGHERLRPFSCSEPELLRKPLLRTPVNKGNGNLVSGASHTRTRRIWRRGEGEALCLMSARPSHATAASNGTLI
jgi:hypothetical protein